MRALPHARLIAVFAASAACLLMLAAPALAGSKPKLTAFATNGAKSGDSFFVCAKNTDSVTVSGKKTFRIASGCKLGGNSKGSTFGTTFANHKRVRYLKITARGPRGADRYTGRFRF